MSRGWWLTDVLAGVFLTILGTVAVVLDLPGPLRVVLVLPMVLFLPGYALLAALYPEASDGTGGIRSFDEDRRSPITTLLGPVERVALAPVLSIGVVSMAVLVSNFTRFGIALRPMLAVVVGVTLAGFVLTVATRLGQPRDDRFSVSPRALLAAIRPRVRRRTGLSSGGPDGRYGALLLASLLLVVASAGYAVAVPPQGVAFTEFSVDTRDVTNETESLYPTTFTAGEPRDLGFVVGNHEHHDETYTVVVAVQRTDGETIREQSEVTRRTVRVPDNESRRVEVAVAPSRTGDDLRVVAYLYRGEAPDHAATETAYRTLRLPIEVQSG